MKKAQEHWAKNIFILCHKMWTKNTILILPMRQYSKQFSRNSFPSYFFYKSNKKTFFYIYFASSLNFTLLPRSLLVCYYFYFSSFFPFFFPTLHRTPLISKSLKSSAFFRNCILFAFFLLSCTAFMLKRAPRC